MLNTLNFVWNTWAMILSVLFNTETSMFFNLSEAVPEFLFCCKCVLQNPGILQHNLGSSYYTLNSVLHPLITDNSMEEAQ